jgi:hypothetical protein
MEFSLECESLLTWKTEKIVADSEVNGVCLKRLWAGNNREEIPGCSPKSSL